METPNCAGALDADKATPLITSRFRPSRVILVARRPDSGRPACMGAKYYPTEKDRKLNQRFQQKQNPLPKFKNSTGKSPVKKSKAR